MTKDEYHKYLKSDAWKRTRKHKIEEARGKCQLCESPDRIQVHHRTYDRIGDEGLSDLIVLCHRCHKRFHDVLPTPQFTTSEITPEWTSHMRRSSATRRTPEQQATLDRLKQEAGLS